MQDLTIGSGLLWLRQGLRQCERRQQRDNGCDRLHLVLPPGPQNDAPMDLYLRKVIQPQAHENYRVILKREDGEFEIGSIGTQHDDG